MMHPVQVARNLYTYRKIAGLRQYEVAERIGAAKDEVSRWENAWSLPCLRHLRSLAKLYGVTVADIAETVVRDGENDIYPDMEV